MACVGHDRMGYVRGEGVVEWCEGWIICRRRWEPEYVEWSGTMMSRRMYHTPPMSSLDSKAVGFQYPALYWGSKTVLRAAKPTGPAPTMQLAFAADTVRRFIDGDLVTGVTTTRDSDAFH